jgi:hypothetical protein
VIVVVHLLVDFCVVYKDVLHALELADDNVVFLDEIADSDAPVGEVVLNGYYTVKIIFVGDFLELAEFFSQGQHNLFKIIGAP